MFRRYLLLFLLLFLLSGCSQTPSTGNPEPSGQYSTLEESALEEQSRFDQLCEEFFQQAVTENTVSLHYSLTRPEDYNIPETAVSLGEFSAEAHQNALKEAGNWISRLLEFSYANLMVDQRKTFDILAAYLNTERASAGFYLYAEPLTVNTGIHVQLPILLAEYRFERLKDVDQYLLLLADLPRYFGDIVNFEREKAAAGLFMADTLADQVISACTDFIAQPENNYLIALFDERLDALALSDPSIVLSYKEKNAALVQNSVIPAYQALINGISALKGSGTGENGLSTYPDGRDYYTWLVRSLTGSSRTPEEMISWLEEDISKLLSALSTQIQNQPELLESYTDFQFPLTDPQEILLDLQAKMEADFPACPKVNTTVLTIPPSLENSSSPAFYLTPPIDDTGTQRIYINPNADNDRLYPTLAHEGYPGHLYQNVYFNACKATPLRYLLSFPGYSEGWATYAELLSYSYCDGEDAESISLMRSILELNLKVSALSDLYVHAKGYTEAELAEFLSSVFGIRPAASREIYLRILGDPANYLSYVIGYMEIEELKEKAENTLGDQFQAKEFHRFLLDFGPAPFAVIEKYMIYQAPSEPDGVKQSNEQKSMNEQ